MRQERRGPDVGRPACRLTVVMLTGLMAEPRKVEMNLP